MMQAVGSAGLAADVGSVLDEPRPISGIKRAISLPANEHFRLNSDGKMTADCLATFARDGFIAIDDLVTPEELAHLRETLMQMHRNNVGFAEGANFDATGRDDGGDFTERKFPQILNPHVFAPDLIGGRYFELATAIAKQLIGDKATFKIDISFMKPPLIGAETAWHQDEAFDNPAYDHQNVTLWLALTPANGDNSCMSYVPGSNKMEILPHQPLGGDPHIHALECISGFEPSDAVEVPLRPGCVSIHACRTLHYAGPNRSTDYRMAYALLFDVPPVLRKVPHHFPWKTNQQTDRLERQKRFRRRGGIIIHVWRERHRIGPWAIRKITRTLAQFRK